MSINLSRTFPFSPKLVLLLTGCCLGIFFGAGTPLAALPAQGKILPSPSRPSVSVTLLNEVGKLIRPVSTAEAASWNQELKTQHPSAARAANLHVWLGEWDLAKNEQPGAARRHFRQAQALTAKRDDWYALAAYDRALSLAYGGAYGDAQEAFGSLLQSKIKTHGYSRIRCALWYRHVSVCAQYHEDHSKLGIPEPTRLDPLCGAAALAACLRSLSRPYDKPTLLKACRVTGEGSTLQDVLDAGHSLGVEAQAVTADDAGLRMLPKPLVAYVEHDHFIAVVRADRKGVSYLCSDCGAWPGGRVDLTWAQWHSLAPELFAVVTPRRSAWSVALSSLSSPGIRIASAGRLTGLLPARVASYIPALPLLKQHTVLIAGPAQSVRCGTSPTSFKCTYDGHMPVDEGSKNDPVNLATGEEDYAPDPDLTVYNPVGPSVVWSRMYESLRGPGRDYPYTSDDSFLDPTYQSDDFGVGWTQAYNVGVVDTIHAYATGVRTMLFANGGTVDFNASTIPTSANPAVLCYAVRSGFPMVLQWDYDAANSAGHFELIMKDRTRWITGSLVAPGNVCPLTQIKDRCGNSIYFNYPTTSASAASYGWPLLSSITTGANGAGTVLLSIQRATDGTGNITSVSDTYGRSVYYQSARYNNGNVPSSYPQYYQEVTHVSQIVPTGTAGPPDRLAYGYQSVSNGEGSETVNFLHSISMPNPNGSSTPSTSWIWYVNDPTSGNPNHSYYISVPFVGALVDSNGNRRLYTSGNNPAAPSYPANSTTVTVQNSASSAVYSYTVSFDNNMNELTRTDGAGNVISSTSYDSVKPYLPYSVSDGNTSQRTFGYYAAGNTITLQFASGPSSEPPLKSQAWFVLGPSSASSDYPGYWVVSQYSNPTHTNLTIPSNAAPGSYIFYNGQKSLAFQVVSGASPAPEQYTWDQFGNMTSETSPRGTVTNYYYSTANFPLGELTGVQEGANLTPPKSPVIYAYWEPSGLVKTVTAPLPGTSGSDLTVTTSFHYDLTSQGDHGLGNVTQIVAPGNGVVGSMTTNFDYGATPAIGQPLTVTDNLSHATHFTYDARGNTTSTTDAVGFETDYGDTGRLNGYNLADQPLLVTLPATGQTGSGRARTAETYLYTGGPLLTQTSYDESGSAIRQVSRSYGSEGELKQASGSTEPASYTYDALYRLSSLTDGNAHATYYLYDSAGYLAQIVYPGASSSLPATPFQCGTADTISFPVHDANGNPMLRIDGKGAAACYAFNTPDSVLTDIQYPGGGAANVNLSYDDYARRSAMTDGTGSQAYAFDDDDELTARTVTYTGLAAKTLSYTYNPDGSRAGMSTPAGAFTYAYDGVGRATGLSNPFGEHTGWSYVANNWLDTQTLANGAWSGYSRNLLGQVTRLLNKAQGGAGATLSDFSGMVYDGAGNRTALSASLPGAPSLNGTTSYQYDYGQTANPALNRGQLTQESTTRNGLLFPTAYGYDPAGNPTSMRGIPNTGFNTDNQTTTGAGNNPPYLSDGNGNPGAARGRALYFDAENRLTGAADQAGGVSTAVAVGPDNLLRLLANNWDGSISLFNVRLSDGGINQTFTPYGPFPGWTAITTAVGPNNLPHVLWNRADGQTSIGAIDANGNYSYIGSNFGPFAGWTATAMAVGPDNFVHLLWQHAPENTITIWSINPSNGAITQNTTNGTVILPAGWSATAMTVDTSNHVHLLLNNVNGQVAHWVDTMPGTPPGFVYTPSGGFTGTGLSAGPPSDPRVRMLLTDPQGDVLTLALNADNSGAASPIFYDLPGLVPVNLSMDGYNVGRLLWSKTTGDNLIQNLLPDNSTSTLTAMTAGHLASTGLTSGYDGDGLRAWKQNDAGQRTYFLYDGADPVCELDAGGSVSAVNTFGATGLLSRRVTGGASVFYTFDERGNVAQRTDAGANVLSSDLYDGYGKKMAGPSDVWGYGAQAGYYTDAETGLVLCTHRFYDPQTGRFITRDPMGYGGGINLYGYTGNNPVNRSDPLGLLTIGGGNFFDTEAIPIGSIAGVPITIGSGGGFSLSIDTHGTLSIGGSLQGQVGVGAAAETGAYGSISPGFNTAPGPSGVGGSVYLYGGGGAEGGNGEVAGEAQVTAPIMSVYPFSTPVKTVHTPTLSGSLGTGVGAAAFIIPLGISGSVNFNLPTLFNNFKNKLKHPFFSPTGDFPPQGVPNPTTAMAGTCG